MAIAIRCIQKRGTRRSDWLNAGGTIRAVELSAPAITGDQPSEHERVALELLEAAPRHDRRGQPASAYAWRFQRCVAGDAAAVRCIRRHNLRVCISDDTTWAEA
jgi:hypothetical protein